MGAITRTQAISSAGGTSTKTADYTVTTGDFTILVDATGPVTITLPPAYAYPGMIVNIKNINTGAVTVARSGSDTIDGVTSWDISAQYDSATFQSNGTNWFVL